jgi:uncharacterized membrane protein YhaH (DUF805 family)
MKYSCAVLACAVLSGVEPLELTLESEMENTKHKLDTGEIVSIVLGGTAVLILLAGLVWFGMQRSRSGEMKQNSDPKTVRFTPFGASAVQECKQVVELPFLQIQN